MRKMLDFERGIQSIFHVQDGQMYVEKTQDVTAIVEANKRQLNSVSGRTDDPMIFSLITAMIFWKTPGSRLM